ncbi:MAG: Thioredoxin reductase [Chloroflexi bacterium ADurb.Bin325]|nr:MAG: Thioredoxin reductase [Chloroflexi bacterium ADurb.Bin325]
MLDGLSFNLGSAGGEEAVEETQAAERGPRPEIENVIIVGSGPAGWSAAIYTARADLRPLLITGNDVGGQIALTTEVENFPGFDSIQGPELVERMQRQAERFGAEALIDYVTEIDMAGPPFTVRTAGGLEFKAKSVIAATGASPRRLGVPGEELLTGRGVSYCATCDGFFFRNKDIMVIGGGDSALQEALFLTKFAARVRIVHRRDQLRAGVTLQRRAQANPKIEFVWNTVVTSINGQNKVETVTLRDLVTGETYDTPTDGVFVYIGHLPNNELFLGKLALDEDGHLITDKLMRTSVPGIFAAGEIQDHRFKQAATSAGQGVAAAMEAEKYLADLEDRTYPGDEGTHAEVKLAA